MTFLKSDFFQKNRWLLIVLKASPLLIPLFFLVYNPYREAKIPNDAKVIDIVIGERKITDRYVISQVTNIAFQYNRGYWDKVLDTCPDPKITAKFELNDESSPFALLFESNWVCARAEFDGKIHNVLWHLPPKVELNLRGTLGVNS